MKLTIKFTKEESDIIFSSPSGIILAVRNKLEIFSLLNNMILRENYIEHLESLLDIERFNYEENPNKRNLNNIHKLLSMINIIKRMKQNLNLLDFDVFELIFEYDTNPLEYKSILESIKKPITIDVSHLSNNNVLLLNKITFYQEPLIKSDLNRYEDVSLKEILETAEIIKEIEDTILKFDISALEKIMMIYDLLKSKIYKKSPDGSLSNSRDLTKVLKNDEIVCLGYCNIFSYIASSLGLENEIKLYKSDDETKKHVTNIVYVNDSKYNFNGIIELDITWDTKKDKDDKEYITNYKWFALSEVQASTRKQKMGYQANPIKAYSFLKSYKSYTKMNEYNPSQIILENYIETLLYHIQELFESIEDKDGIVMLAILKSKLELHTKIEKKEIDDLIKYTKSVCIRKIKFSDFVKILYTVRRIEHYLDSNKYPLSRDSIMASIMKRFTPDEILMASIIEDNDVDDVIESLEYLKDIDNNKIETDAKRMELLNTLANIKTK